MENLINKMSYWLSFSLDMYIKLHIVGFKAFNIFVEHEQHTAEETLLLISTIFITIVVISLDLFFIVFVIFICCFSFQNLFIKLRTHEIRRNSVTAIVIKINWVESYGFMLRFLAHCKMSETELVLKYDDPDSKLKPLIESFDDRNLFFNYSIGDEVPVILVEKINKKNKVIHRTLELPE